MRIDLGRGYQTEIDFSDWWKVQGYTWRVLINPTQKYAVTWADGRHQTMQNFIKPPPPGMVVDHEDRDGLNNRWANLRFATASQNSHNTDQPVGRSGYRGVIRHGYTDKWRARISVRGTIYEDGPHDTPEEAARARDRLAIEHHGAFAVLNFPKE